MKSIYPIIQLLQLNDNHTVTSLKVANTQAAKIGA